MLRAVVAVVDVLAIDVDAISCNILITLVEVTAAVMASVLTVAVEY